MSSLFKHDWKERLARELKLTAIKLVCAVIACVFVWFVTNWAVAKMGDRLVENIKSRNKLSGAKTTSE
jgi:hypothetical protein